ncbi:MAG: RluA family pseudouridine synthase [Sandaracinaceae bacterium]
MIEPRVVYEDADLLVVAKPSGMPTTAPHGAECLTAWAEDQQGRQLHPTSRLDAEVTGLVTFAITRRGIAHLIEARRKGRYGRRYLALASGTFADAEGIWDRAIAIDPKDRRLRVAVDPGARGQRVQRARTAYEVGARTEHVSLLWLRPHTGRTHQLRVHAADAGHPLLGDVRYGGPKRLVLEDGRVLAARRVMLHCARLELPVVEGEGALVLRADAPDDLCQLWIALGGASDALAIDP